MNRLLYPISVEDFKQNVRIYFDNISEGFSKFKHEMLEGKNEDELIEYMQNAYDENGFDNFYVDLYFNRIDESNEDKFLELLIEEDKEVYKLIKSQYDSNMIYYKVDKSLVPFITRLSTRELLFCTIYLTKTNKTIWGNYNKIFPIFYI